MYSNVLSFEGCSLLCAIYHELYSSAACFTLKSHNIYKSNHIKRTLSHVHRVCDVYVNLVLKKKINILGRIGLNFGGFGEHLN